MAPLRNTVLPLLVLLSTGLSCLAAPTLSFTSVRFSQKFELVNGSKAQVVEVTVANTASSQSASTSINTNYTVDLTGAGVKTVTPGVLRRLVAGDQKIVKVLVTGTLSGNTTAEVKDNTGKVALSKGNFPVTPLKSSWKATSSDVAIHESPDWFNDAKFGIFIHWGPYSVPAYGPPKSYAEWYDYDLHTPPLNSSNPTWAHHLANWGPNVVYDDFIPMFTAKNFNPSDWVNLFDEAGAKYFVQVTKHHDGFAIFDTGNTTNRSSVKLGPKRDLLNELFTVAKNEKPNLRRGTYYSLPEWYNPDYKKYGFSEWPGGLATNAFNASKGLEPYTGHVNITDYLTDLQLPHQLTLMNKYDTEIMWCDIGGPNMFPQMASTFFNQAFSQNRQVVVNNRCGASGDFDTPEYTKLGSTQVRKWESNEGMDPFSYGLNDATPASAYKNGTAIVQNLVDIVSKNGNFLLDVGPDATGQIIPAMQAGLLQTGAWLKYGGPCIYGTRYWHKKPQDASGNLRYLQTDNTFCVISLSQPKNNQFAVPDLVPILPGDRIDLLGAPSHSGGLPWTLSGNTLTINVSNADIATVQYAYAFQITYET
ncbi:hypothetical protein GALMADRAFT_218912 [Galerina marginata CBS 339.88]|uniref:alpha-L-fucosidase n=1 Tax=Galerina marginata (strain CBS 339.88) TaxID=685588 RepID=A0A067TRI2_GALM3|nr:hypothetical protein GALMADRAFT_218912 [Galerina marginata CBS 339.88]